MAARSALLWAAVHVPSFVVMWTVADTAVRLDAHPLLAAVLGLLALWGSAEVLDRLTAPLHATRTR